jgi:hypothetical protein
MQKLHRLLTPVVLIILGAMSLIQAQTPEAKQIEEKRKVYLDLVQKLKTGSKDVHFGHLRRAFVEWKLSGGADTEHPKRRDMVKAFEAQNNALAVKLAEEVLDFEFYNHNIFGAVTDAYKALNNSEKFDYYNNLY